MGETSTYVTSPDNYSTASSYTSQSTSDSPSENSGQIFAHYFLCLTLIIVWFAAIKACVTLFTKPTCLCECCARVCHKSRSSEAEVHTDITSGAGIELSTLGVFDLGSAPDSPPNYETALTMPIPHGLSSRGEHAGDINIAYTHSVINLSHVEPGVVLRVNGVGIETSLSMETDIRTATDSAVSRPVESMDVTQCEDTLGASNPAFELPSYDEALHMAMTRPGVCIEHVLPVPTAHAPESVTMDVTDNAVSDQIVSVSNPVAELPSYEEALHMN